MLLALKWSCLSLKKGRALSSGCAFLTLIIDVPSNMPTADSILVLYVKWLACMNVLGCSEFLKCAAGLTAMALYTSLDVTTVTSTKRVNNVAYGVKHSKQG
jgi:hypothetical protein